MHISQTAVAAGLLALPLAAAHPTAPLTKRAGSFKLALSRRSGGSSLKTDETNLGTIYSDTDWITPVTIGGQKFSLQVDTGSSDTWLLSTLMPSDKQKQFPQNHFYDPTKSSSYKAVDGSSFNISYGSTGAIYGAGKVGTDNIEIGSSTVSMEFGLANDCSPVGMVDTTYDGLLGLAFGGGNTFKPNPGPTFMEAVQAQLDEPVFTFNIPASSKSQQMLEFGHVDHSLYKGSLATAAINNGTTQLATGWLGTGSLSMGGKNISSEQQQFLFDTGGLAGTARPDAVKAYWSQVSGAKDTSSGQDGTGWAAPCSGGNPPDLTYDFVAPDGSTASATIPGNLMISTQPLGSDNTMCSGALQSDGGSGGANLGYAFFHAQFTVFDQSKATVSFAPYSDASENGSSGNDESTSSASSSSPSGTASASSSASGSSSSGSSGSSSSSGGSSPSSTDGPAVKPTATAGSATKPTASANNNAASATAGSSPAAPSASDSAPGGSGDTPKKSGASAKAQASGALLALVASCIGYLAL